MSFSQWNQKLTDHFFGDFAQEKRVRLSVTADLLDEEFQDLGGVREFKRIVQTGPDWPAHFEGEQHWGQPSSLKDRAIGLFQQWKYKVPRSPEYVLVSNDGPPYLPYLCMLCLAWTWDADHLSANNFFERLDCLYPDHNLNDHLIELGCLWEGLEDWTKRTDGRFGQFRIENLGGMPYVGIPKSQVILTASKLEKLPFLFDAIGLSAGAELTNEKLRSRLLHRTSTMMQCLGSEISEAILKRDSLGESALDQLLEHLNEWDGDVPFKDRYDSENVERGTTRSVSRIGELLVGLRPVDENKAWKREVYVTATGIPDGLLRFDLNNEMWEARLIDGHGGPIVKAGSDEKLDSDYLRAGQMVSANWVDEGQGEQSINLAFTDKQIRVFSWQRNVLVEQSGIPQEGYAYLLVKRDLLPNLKLWSEELPRCVCFNQELPQAGLHGNGFLGYLSPLGLIPDEAWKMFPDGGNQRRPKLIRVLGGARARRASIRRVYLPYDPPRVIVLAEGISCISAIGAELEEQQQEGNTIPAWAKPDESPKVRIFKVLPDDSSSMVSVVVKRDDQEVAKVNFGLLRDKNGIDLVRPEEFHIDYAGNLKQEPVGVLGPTCPIHQQWTYRNGSSAKWPVSDWGQPSRGQILLDWIENFGVASFGRVRDFCNERLSGMEINYLSREFEALSQLGHIEIGSDTRGRWSYVHAVPCVLYSLPFLREGCYQVVVGGTITTSQLKQIATAAQTENIQVEFHPQLGGSPSAFSLVPPRICLIASDLNQVRSLSSACAIEFVDGVPAFDVAKWSADLSGWEETLNWFSEVEIDIADAIYEPCRFRTANGDRWPIWGDYKLARRPDEITGKHFSYSLTHRFDSQFRHAYIRQRAWGCWKVHVETMMSFSREYNLDLDKVPIAFDEDENMLVFPRELEPPTLLSRALVLCSGLAPYRLSVDEFDAYKSPSNNFGWGYGGVCTGYKHVPKEIATLVLSKLRSKPVSYIPMR